MLVLGIIIGFTFCMILQLVSDAADRRKQRKAALKIGEEHRAWLADFDAWRAKADATHAATMERWDADIAAARAGELGRRSSER